MQPPDQDPLPKSPPPPVDPSRGEYPDQAARTESGPVSTEFSSGTERRTKRRAMLVAGVLIVGFLLTSILRFLHAHSVANASEAAYSKPPPVDVVTVQAAVAGQDLVLPGATAAWFETTIYARVGGYVASWNVDIGDRVAKGQVLATIETPELDAQLAAAKAELQASQAQVAARRAEAEFSKSTNERWRDSPKGVVSEQERESKRADFESAEARLYAANAQVALDKSKVDQYNAMTEFRQVKAPFDGTITERKIDVGNLVVAGGGVTTSSLYRMAQTDPLRVFVEVPQSASGELMKSGVPAEIRATGAVGGIFTAKTARAAQSLDSQARTMRVEVDVPNADHLLVPGMYVNVAFRLPPRGSVEVPAASLIFRASGAQVARVDANGKVAFSDVTIARDNGSLVELASGAKVGDRLILNISSQVAAGQTVAPNLSEQPRPPLDAKR